MSKYYDANEVEAVLEELEVLYDGTSFFTGICMAHNSIRKVPTVDVAPIVHGHWIYMDTYRTISRYKCSECERIVTQKENSCPRCFARMDKEVKENGEIH